MGSKNKFTKVIVVLAVLFLGGLVYLFLQIKQAGNVWPYDNEPGTLSFEVGQLQKDVKRLQDEVKKIPPAKEQLDKVRVDYDLATRVLPKENSPDQLIAAIRTKAEQAGVVPDRLIPAVVGAAARQARGAARAAAGAFEEWSFTLDIRGSYDQIATFVNRMEEFESSDPSKTGSEKRFFQVRDIDITAEADGLANLGMGAATGPEAKRGHQCVLIMQTYRFTGSQ